MRLTPGCKALSMGAVCAIALASAGPASAIHSGTNGELAFTSTQDGGARHIFVRGPLGITDLTGAGSAAVETQPKFSPDGREIVFTRQAAGLPNSEIFVMSATGTQRTQLTNTRTSNSDPTWSPDGTQLAFVSTRQGGVPNIFVMRTDGTGVRQITRDSASKSQLAWSPRGDRIAFVREPAGGGDRDIYSIKPDGTGLTDLSQDPNSDDVEPAYSPDGQHIAYSGPFHPGRESVGGDLWVMNSDGSNPQPLEHENNGYSDGAYPAWSPDGTTIAFTANNGTGYYHVWSVPAAGGLNIELVTNQVPGGNPVDQELDWQSQPAGPAPAVKIVAAATNRKRHALTARFSATGPATSYRCALALGGRKLRWRPCHSPMTYTHLKPGHYTFAVKASAPGEAYRGVAKRKVTLK